MTHPEQTHYLIGFWYRLGAGTIDGIITALPLLVILLVFQLLDASPLVHSLLGGLILMCYQTWFWVRRSATPGNWLFSHQLVDHKTGQPIAIRQGIIRFLASIVSAVPVFLGYFWVIWDKEKRSWHDKVAGTVVLSDSSYQSDASDRVYHPS